MEDNLNEIVEEENSDVEANVETTVEANGDLETDVLADFVDITETETGEETSEETTEETDETETPAPVQKITFGDRAVEMGLTVLAAGSYHYADVFSEIIYKNVKTLGESGIVDDEEISHLAIFTKGLEDDAEWKYQNFISDAYKFLGNATLINPIKESIGAIGNADLIERTFISPDNTKIRHEIVISHENVIPEVGTIFPMMNISNTYNGTGASVIVFGMSIAESAELVSSFCTEKFGKIKQIHLAGSSTELEAAFGEYVSVFNDNIASLVSENFTNNITEDDMLKVLDIIEAKAGKKRREMISNELPSSEVEEGQTAVPWSMTSWQLFLTLTRFTSVEENLNSKKILENIAERVLIVPAQMKDALKVING
jgi:hypothetical protein